MRKNIRKRFMPNINYLSVINTNDILKGRDYSQPVDSEEAFKYRRNDDEVRRKLYDAMRRAGIPSRDAQRFKDWKPHHVKDLLRHKEMDDYGLSPEWIQNPERRVEKIQEMKKDYLKAGIQKEPNEPLTPQETERLNNVLRAEGKPEVESQTDADYETKKIQRRAKLRHKLNNNKGRYNES